MVRAFTHGAMGRRIDPSWGGPIDQFLVPASAPRLWDSAYKIPLAANQKGVVHVVAEAGFLSRYLNGPLP